MEDSKLEALFEEFLLIYKVVNRKNIIDVLRSELNTEQLIEIYQRSVCRIKEQVFPFYDSPHMEQMGFTWVSCSRQAKRAL